MACKLWEPVAERENFIQVDCTKYMTKNPESVVRKHHTAQDQDAQTTVFEQEGFPIIMKWLLDEIWTCQHVSLACNWGQHRSNVCGCFLESALNSVVDGQGRRAFNAMHFTTNGLEQREVDTVIQRAGDWHREPWCLQKTVPMDEVFGKEAAMKSRDAFMNWTACMDVIGDWARRAGAAAEEERHYPHPPLEEPPAKLYRGSVGAVPVPARQLPSASIGSAAPSAETYQQEQHGDVGGYAAAGSGDAPDWVSFEPKAERWHAFLQAQGVDEISQQELFLLASLSHEGWYAANSVLAKLAKKTADGEVIRNPSAFVHACVINARGTIQHGWFPPSGKGGKP